MSLHNFFLNISTLDPIRFDEIGFGQSKLGLIDGNVYGPEQSHNLGPFRQAGIMFLCTERPEETDCGPELIKIRFYLCKLS